MPRIVNFGSCCIDMLLSVPRIAAPGETLAATGDARMAGGKGLNQSIAAARGGAVVAHFGAVGSDGTDLLDLLREAGVDVSGVEVSADRPTGRAVVQVAADGENAIVIVPGANRGLPRRIMETAVDGLGAGDWLLLQNETDWVPEAIARAAAGPGRVALNLAPADPAARDWPLEELDLLIVNETEALMLTDEASPEAQIAALHARCPRAWIALTLGAEGAILAAGDAHPEGAARFACAALAVDVVDTTGAGDAFTGHLLAALSAGLAPREALARAAVAGALACTLAGAAPSIPTAAAVDGRLV
ncbi:MAG TPA: PfkB family carbohydrate kinase [Pseudomonadales bacterium]|nr:PfkB family carbohydrate kinase [Pseudomonadales bacterium]